MTIRDLIVAIKEQGLTKEQLEGYHSELTSLYATMSLDMADIEKEEALYLNDCEEPTKAGAERKWNATEQGQKAITLKHNLRAIEKLLSSVKSRIYQIY